jgi:hypothetical protein
MRVARVVVALSMSAGMMLGSLGVAAATTGDPSSRATFANCTALNKTYPHGVEKLRYAKAQWTRKGATGQPAYRPRVYSSVYTTMDRDRDGVACER